MDDVTPTPGQSITLSATVHNSGGSTSSSTTLRYYRATDFIITANDTQVGTDALGILSANATRSETLTITAPSIAGTYYYGACIDTVSNEVNIYDNCSGSDAVEVIVSSNNSLSLNNSNVLSLAIVIEANNTPVPEPIIQYLPNFSYNGNSFDILSSESQLGVLNIYDTEVVIRETIITEDDNVSYEDTSYQLLPTKEVLASKEGNSAYIYKIDDGATLSVYEASTDGSVNYQSSIEDTTTSHFAGASALDIQQVAEKKLLFITGTDESGLSIFEVSSDGNISYVESITDSENTDYQFSGASSLSHGVFDDSTIVFVGSNTDGISAFNVGADGTLEYKWSVASSDTDLLGSAAAHTSVEMATTAYIFTASEQEAGISVFEIDNALGFIHRHTLSSLLDGDLSDINNFRVVQIEGDYYLFSIRNNGETSIFSIGNDGYLEFQNNIAGINSYKDHQFSLAKAVSLLKISDDIYFLIESKSGKLEILKAFINESFLMKGITNVYSNFFCKI